MKTILPTFILLVGLLAARENPPCCREVAAEKPLADKSLYQLESKWTSDAGSEVKLGILRGRPQVVAMFFASCEYACPVIVENLREIERKLPEELRGRVDFLLVSFDTGRDTAAVLHAYREKQALSVKNWTLLRGGEDDVRELSALLGVNHKKDARGQFSHSNIITVLDAEGVVAFQQTGLNKDAAETIAALQKLPPTKPAP
ncbi:MAG: SCO family protein [Luteolibacter sp.]